MNSFNLIIITKNIYFFPVGRISASFYRPVRFKMYVEAKSPFFKKIENVLKLGNFNSKYRDFSLWDFGKKSVDFTICKHYVIFCLNKQKMTKIVIFIESTIFGVKHIFSNSQVDKNSMRYVMLRKF